MDVGFWVLNSNSFIVQSKSKLRGRVANTGVASALAINENSSEATVSVAGIVRAKNDVTVSADSTNKESTQKPPPEWDPNPDDPAPDHAVRQLGELHPRAVDLPADDAGREGTAGRRGGNRPGDEHERRGRRDRRRGDGLGTR